MNPSLPKIFAIPALALLTACATPQERCIADATRDLNVVTQLIGQTNANLQRGFGLQDETVYHTEFQDCTPSATKEHPKPPPQLCPVQVPVTKSKPVAIDLGAEKAKLVGLQKKQSQLQSSANAAIAQCRAIHPK